MTQSGFIAHLSPEFPSQVNFDITEFCNLACLHCPYEVVTKVKGRNRQHLDVGLHHKIIEEIAENGRGYCEYLRYTGDGEPLLHPKVMELLGYAKVRTKLPINLTTNGSFLKDEKIDALIDMGIDVVDVSIDAATSETYAKVRVNGDFEVTQANTQRLVRKAKERGKTRVVVSFVEQEVNRAETLQFQSFWQNAGVERVIIRTRHSCAGFIDEIAKEMWGSAPPSRTPCRYPWERLVIKPDGMVGYCPADWLHQANVGDAREQTLQEIWSGAEMAALRAAHESADFSKHSFCGQCPDWQVIPWPEERKDYARMMRQLAS